MAIALPQSVKKIMQYKAYGHVITFNANGTPQVTMVWSEKHLIVRVKVDRIGGYGPRCNLGRNAFGVAL